MALSREHAPVLTGRNRDDERRRFCRFLAADSGVSIKTQPNVSQRTIWAEANAAPRR
jgi:hypothetical protein